MKRLNYFILLVGMMGFLLVGQSCKKEETDPCVGVICQNDGTCVDGSCNCPAGFAGDFCEITLSIQERLLTESPLDILNSGVSIDSLYGKTYVGGFIFYLNTMDGTGMVAATEDQSENAEWGCIGVDIPNLVNVALLAAPPWVDLTAAGANIGEGESNTNAILAACNETNIAAKLCRDLGDEWFLPSIGELNLMYENLFLKGHGNIGNDFFWSSSENADLNSWLQAFFNGEQGIADKDFVGVYVRAVRAF